LRLPVLPEVLVRFITEMVEGECGQGGRSIATVRRYLSTLSTLHRLLDVPDPTKAQIVRNTLKARTRRSGGQTQAAPLRWEQVQQVIEVLPNDLPGLRDKTLLAVAHNSLARRAELVAIDVADVQFLEDGVATVALRPTKTNLEAERDYRFLAAPTTALVKEWLALRISANVTARSGDRDRCAHRSGAGVDYSDRAVTISQIGLGLSHRISSQW
jgi:integrase